MVSFQHNFLFIHIPKTAGNSIQNVLRAYSEDDIVSLAPHQDGIERFEVRSKNFDFHKHSTLQDYRAKLGNEVFQRMFKFTSVRNPWDRMISFYFSPHREPISWSRDAFVKFIAHIPPITAYVCPKGESNSEPICFNPICFHNIDYFIRYECLNDDFKNVCELIGIPWEPLPIRNKSKRQPYADYYDDELVELVRNKFAEEISYFGYEFGEIPDKVLHPSHPVNSVDTQEGFQPILRQYPEHLNSSDQLGHGGHRPMSGGASQHGMKSRRRGI